MADELQTLQLPAHNFSGIILVTFLALVLVFLIVYLIGKKQEWTSKKRGFFMGGLICLILAMSIVLGMFSYYGSCTKFADHELCGQFIALIYPSNIIFGLIFAIPSFLIGGLIGWIIGKIKSPTPTSN